MTLILRILPIAFTLPLMAAEPEITARVEDLHVTRLEGSGLVRIGFDFILSITNRRAVSTSILDGGVIGSAVWRMLENGKREYLIGQGTAIRFERAAYPECRMLAPGERL